MHDIKRMDSGALNSDFSLLCRTSARRSERRDLGLRWADNPSKDIAEYLAVHLEPDLVDKSPGGLVEWRAPTLSFNDKGSWCLTGAPEGCFRLITVRDECTSVLTPRPRRVSLVMVFPLLIPWDRKEASTSFYEGLSYDPLQESVTVRGESVSLGLSVIYICSKISSGKTDPSFARDDFLSLFGKLAAEDGRGDGIPSDDPAPWHNVVLNYLSGLAGPKRS